MLALLTALALAAVFSERLAQPLARLADGTGGRRRRLFAAAPVEGRDELSVLTQSFNTMTEQLADAASAIGPTAARSKPAIFISRTFSKNLNTGVLVLTDDFVLRGQRRRRGDPAGAH